MRAPECKYSILFVLIVLTTACSTDPSSDSGLTHQTASLTLSAPPAAEDLATIEAQIDSVKNQLSDPSIDASHAASLTTQIEDLHRKRAVLRGNTEKPQPPQIPPMTSALAAKRKGLLSKMKDFDMTNPADAERWADLKRTELGQ